MSEATMRDSRLQLAVRLPCSWDCIESIRQSVVLCITVALGNPAVAEQLGMAVSELLENAIKHGGPGSIELSLVEDDGKLVATVKNSLLEGNQSAGSLKQRLGWLAEFSSPRAAYLAAMAAVYAADLTSMASTQSTLGLARIAHEGACRLECDTSESGYVRVRAIHELQAASVGA